MFAALGRIASRRPWFVIAAWILVGIAIVATAPGLKATTTQADFLPKHYESVRAIELGAKAFGQLAETPAAEIVFSRHDGGQLTDADKATITDVLATEATKVTDKDYPSFKALDTANVVKNDQNLVEYAHVYAAKDVSWQAEKDFDSVVDLRKSLHKAVEGTDLTVGLTGDGPSNYDQSKSGKAAEAIVMLSTVVLIFILLGFIFRSVLIAFFPIITIGLVAAIANGTIGWAAELFNLKVDSSVNALLIVVLFGIGTDYILFYLFRYRERLRAGDDIRSAVATAVHRSGEAIASAGGAVIVAFATLILSSLGMFRSMGPALAIAVAVTVIASVTLVPAVTTVLGKALFWPSKNWRVESEGSFYARLGGWMENRPVRNAVVSGGILVVLSIFALQFHPNFDLSTGASTTTETAKTDKIKEAGGYGVGDGVQVLLHAKGNGTLTEDEVTTYATDLSASFGAPVAAIPNPQTGKPFISADGKTAILMTQLKDDSMSDAAIRQVKNDLRPAAQKAAPTGTEALIGGITSVFVDFQKAMARDYSIVFPVAAAITLLILMLVLRSLVAPWYLMASVGLGFGATLGASVLLFQHFLGHSGIIFMLPIYIYLFVVALGTDYNILMISRLREEAREGKTPRQSAAWAVRHAGPTIAAAGVILAGTFASLMLGGNSLFLEMGFAISFGIAVAAFVMALFFTPALTALIGHAAWWPGHGDESRADKH